MDETDISDEVIKFINEKYKKSTIYDLNEEISRYNKQTKKESEILKSLIPNNFTNFIKCKSLLERIKADFSAKNLLKDNLIDDLYNIKSRFQNILEVSNLDLKSKENQEKLVFRKKYATLINLKQNLRTSIQDHQAFYNLLKNARSRMKEVENVPLFNNIMSEIEPEIKDCLDDIYNKITDSSTFYEECCTLCEYYFLISDTKIGAEESNIINTLLVNFKQSTYFRKIANEEYYIYLNSSLFRLIKYMNEDQLQDAIRHYFMCLNDIIECKCCGYFKTVILRIQDFQKSLKVFPTCLKYFRDSFSKFKIDAFRRFLDSVLIDAVPDIFNLFLSFLELKDVNKAQEIIFNKTLKFLLDSKLTGIEYLNSEINELKIVKPCFGSEKSSFMKKLESNVSDLRNKAVLSISQQFKDNFYKYDDYGILMKCLRVTVEIPEYCSKVFVECKDEIYRRSIVLYYLHQYMGIKIPVLSKDEILKINDMNIQFECLIKK